MYILKFMKIIKFMSEFLEKVGWADRWMGGWRKDSDWGKSNSKDRLQQ